MSAGSAPVTIVLVHGGFVDGSGWRFMAGRAGATTVEVAASHSVYLSQPAAVADLIEQAATAVAARAQPRPLSTAQMTARPLGRGCTLVLPAAGPAPGQRDSGGTRTRPQEGTTGRQE